ncbi:MAG TPA: hypothetical protein VGB75_14980 [Jatrophihabitans sp.]|uniref:hypothetical protein n=1 Tax=Jatrophihabitans sp. TaxID=1932789 RepID=UPI002EECF610
MDDSSPVEQVFAVAKGVDKIVPLFMSKHQPPGIRDLQVMKTAGAGSGADEET